MITYRYLSDGTKVSAEAVLEPEIDEGDGIIPARIYRRRYKGNFTYVTDPDTGEETLESIAWNEGMIYLRKMAEPSEPVDTLGVIDGDIIADIVDTLAVVDAGNRIIYDRWYVKDHLGNVRTVVELGSHVGEIVEQDDYLPFGTRFTPATQGVICTMDTELYGSEHDNRYRYAGKEEQRFGPQIDLGLLDFGARSYDTFTARWTSVDPLSHKYLGFSPYNYCGGNPVMYFDPDGRIVDVKGSAEFIQKYEDMRNWLRENNCDELLTLLENNQNVTITVIESAEHTKYRTTHTTAEKGHATRGEILIDFNHIAVTGNGNKLSPAVQFMHEVDHAYVAAEDYQKFTDMKKLEMSSFGNALEMRAILGTETATAVALGEIPTGTISRTSHSGTEESIPAEWSIKFQSIYCGRINNPGNIKPIKPSAVLLPPPLKCL